MNSPILQATVFDIGSKQSARRDGVVERSLINHTGNYQEWRHSELITRENK
jgi:hypothetical protein